MNELLTGIALHVAAALWLLTVGYGIGAMHTFKAFDEKRKAKP